MRYYTFHIGDYLAHTSHLDDLDDLAYRRMLDVYYLHEKPLPVDAEKVAKLVRMRTECERIANVLQEFFDLTDDGWVHHRVESELEQIEQKSAKARASAKARWQKKGKNGAKPDASAMRTQCERNANGMLPITHNPIPNTHNPNEHTHTLDNIYLSTQMAEFALQVWQDNNAILDVDAEWQRFVDYHKATGKHYDNWESAWQFWVADDKTLSRGI